MEGCDNLMSTEEKLLQSIMSGKQDQNIKFIELTKILKNMGFSLDRISGSHHVFTYPGIIDIIDLQPDKHDHSKAKPYQVKQVRNFIRKYLEE